MSHNLRELQGILYNAICGHCGHCIDYHDNPEMYGIEEWTQKERLQGFHSSLFSCRGFRVRRVDKSNVILTTAKRLYYGEPIPEFFWDCRGVKKKAEVLLMQKRDDWEQEESNRYSANYGAVILIVKTSSGVSFALDIGTA